MQEESTPPSASRRGFMQAALATLGAAQLPAAPAAAAGPDAPAAPAQPVRLMVNGKAYTLSLEPRVTLLDALREVASLPGTKKGCDRGQCGACTVLVDGRRINACLTLAVMQEGASITTIEGIGSAEQLAPIQLAFIEHDAFQCGYCTPGQICSAIGALSEMRAGMPSAVTAPGKAIVVSDEEIRERMSGNICRCGAYPNIVAAVRSVA